MHNFVLKKENRIKNEKNEKINKFEITNDLHSFSLHFPLTNKNTFETHTNTQPININSNMIF